jgi:hypothetical protein
MRVENRVDGASIIRPGTGHQRLLVATKHPAEVIIVCPASESVSCKRHYDESLRKTIPCECGGPCYTQRIDHFLGVLYRSGPTLWEERVMILPANAWHCLRSSAAVKGMDPDDIVGLRCIVQRHGDSSNGRSTCTVQDRVKACPGGFPLAAGIRNCTGIAADFFGDANGDLFLEEIIPAKSRSEKPRVPLGRKGG